MRAVQALAAHVERRGCAVEVGIKAVQCLEGEAIWEAAEAGRWVRDFSAHSPQNAPHV